MTTLMKIGKAISALALIFVVAPAWAEPTITAKVSANDMTLDSSVTLLLEVQGINNVGSAPNLQLPDFQVQPAGQTSSFQWINGQSSSLITFNYVLSPTKTGQLLIPSLSLQIGGKTYSTQPLTITVRAANGSSGGASTIGSRNDARSRFSIGTRSQRRTQTNFHDGQR